MVAKTVARLFDMRMHDKARLIEVFERHNAEVQARIPPERLLVFELSEGWAPLCRFLDVPEPAGAIPKVNTTEEFWTSRGLPVPEPATPS
jgi:hypothetical protein